MCDILNDCQNTPVERSFIWFYNVLLNYGGQEIFSYLNGGT